MNLTTMNYIGNVKVSIKIKDKVYEIKNHNTGLPALSRTFCMVMTGNPVTIEDIPQYLDIRKSPQGGGAYETCLIQKVPLSANSYTYDEQLQNYVAKFTATIRYDYLINPITKYDLENYRLYLVSGSLGLDSTDTPTGYYELAFLESSADVLSYLSPGTQAIIEWTLQIVDKNTESA